jgi:hypothetical protein
MKALTYEAGHQSREIKFSRYELCRVIGWEPDGRAYQRLEESFDRIAGTTLKFKDAWWDKGAKEWKSETFHLVERVSLCSREQLDRRRVVSGDSGQKLCAFVWSDVIWKSFQDGFIKTLNMNQFRRIASGRRREVPLRLFRILDKRFHNRTAAIIELERLCVGTLGLSPSYSPSQMVRVLERAVDWLIECEYLASMRIEGKRLGRDSRVVFHKHVPKRRREGGSIVPLLRPPSEKADPKAWLSRYDESWLEAEEAEALKTGFGSGLQRRIIQDEVQSGRTLKQSGHIRIDYLRRYLEERNGGG